MKNAIQKQQVKLTETKEVTTPYDHLQHRADKYQKQFIYKFIKSRYKEHHTAKHYMSKIGIDVLRNLECFKKIKPEVLQNRIRRVFKKYKELNEIQVPTQYCAKRNKPVGSYVGIKNKESKFMTESLEHFLSRGGQINKVTNKSKRKGV